MAETKLFLDNPKLADEYDMLKKELKSIALSVGPAVYVSVEQLDRDYIDINSYPVPYRKFGYNSFVDLLKSMPDALALVDCGGAGDDNGTTAVVPISDAKTLHIENLIAGQRPSSPTRFGGMVPGLDNNNQRESGSGHQSHRHNDNNRHHQNNYNHRSFKNNARNRQGQNSSASSTTTTTRNVNPPAPKLPSTMIQNFRDRHNAINNCQILPGYENIWLESAMKFGAKRQNPVDSSVCPNNNPPPPNLNSHQPTNQPDRPSFKDALDQNPLFRRATNQISSPRKMLSNQNSSPVDSYSATANRNGFAVYRFSPPRDSSNRFPRPNTSCRFSPPRRDFSASQFATAQMSTNHRKSPPAYSTHKEADFPDGEFLEIVVENLLNLLRQTTPIRSFSLEDVQRMYKNRYVEDPPLELLESFSSTIDEFVADNLSSKIELFKMADGQIFLRYKPQTVTEAINDARYCREMPKIRKETPDELYNPSLVNSPRKNDDSASKRFSTVNQSKLATPLKPGPSTPPTTAKIANDSTTTVNVNRSIFDTSSIRRMAYEIAFGEPCPTQPLNHLDADDDAEGAASASSAASTVLKRDPAVLAYEKQKTLPQQSTQPPAGRHFDAQEFVRRAAAAVETRREYGLPDQTYNKF